MPSRNIQRPFLSWYSSEEHLDCQPQQYTELICCVRNQSPDNT
nr:MAG TPA: hypothetical protein [Caudoviricetes sp.]